MNLAKATRVSLLGGLALAVAFLAQGCGGGGESTSSSPPPPPATQPTISLSPSSMTVSLGGSGDFTITKSGSPTPTVSCSAGVGTVSVSGTSATYTAPTQPSANFDTDPAAQKTDVTCTAQNSAGSASSSATVNLEYPSPQLTASGNTSFFLPREAVIGGVILDVNGVFENITVFNSSDDNIFGARLVSPTQVELLLNFDTPHWNPGFFEVWASNPAPGGGESNRVRLAFLGNLNTLACNATDCFQLDQGGPLTDPPTPSSNGRVHRFDFRSGSKLSEFTPGSWLSNSVAVDEKTDWIAVGLLWVVGLRAERGLFTATYDPDGPGSQPEQDVTLDAVWNSLNTSVATTTSVPGHFEPHDPGTAAITAKYAGLTATAFFGVDVPEPNSLFITPWPYGIISAPGATAQFTACDGKLCGPKSPEDVTASAVWDSSDTSVAVPTGVAGEFRGVNPGTANITATYNGLTSTGIIGVGMAPPVLLVKPDTVTYSPFVTGARNEKIVMDVTAGSGYICATQDADGLLSSVDTTQIRSFAPAPQMISMAIGDEPWNVAMTSLGSQLVCNVFNIEDLWFSVVNVPAMTLAKSVQLAGLTPASQLAGATSGGWQLAVFDSGTAASTAALLHQADKKVVFLDLNSTPLQELRRVDLTGIPFRIAADNTNGTLIVALADVASGLTQFEKIDVATGTVTQLQTTTDLLATGFGVSADGTKLYVANRDQFQILPNN